MKRFYLIIMPVMMRPDLMPNFRAEKNWSEFLKVQMPEIWMFSAGTPSLMS